MSRETVEQACSSDSLERGRGRCIVAGYGPVGRVVEAGLVRAGYKVTVIDLNPATVQRLRERRKSAVCGDATDPQVLREAGLEQAAALILTMPDEEQALTACRVGRALAPRVFISARTNFLSKGMLATAAGANHVTVEEVVTAEAMQRAVVDHLHRLDAEED